MRVHEWSTCGIPAIVVLLLTTGIGLGAARAGVLLQSSSGQKTPRFVGVDHCAKCHTSEGTNFQVQVWEKGPHADAYKILDGKRAAEVAKEAGIKGSPQLAPECLRCHTTAYGEPSWRYAKSFDATQGVSCESCHGAGEHYAAIEHMITKREAVAMGLKEPAKSVCLKCHNEESPTYKGFDYVEAVRIIQHPLPKY